MPSDISLLVHLCSNQVGMSNCFETQETHNKRAVFQRLLVPFKKKKKWHGGERNSTIPLDKVREQVHEGHNGGHDDIYH